MTDAFAHLLWLAVAWLAYFGLHSVLASLPVKHAVARRWPALMPAYRLGFNLIAGLTLLPLLWWVYAFDGPLLLHWAGPAFWFANGLALAALGGFFWSLGHYDGGEFIGLRQWRERETRVEDQENFHISPLHRHVRHPWYALGLVLIWTRDMNAAWLLSALAMTAYFVIGSRLEERKLISYYGEVYREYRRRVPGLLPLPWRRLSADEAAQLVRRSRSGQAQ